MSKFHINFNFNSIINFLIDKNKFKRIILSTLYKYIKLINDQITKKF